MPFIGGEVELGRWRLQSRRLWLRPLGVNTNSGKLVAEATAALKRARRGGLGRREGCSEVGTRRWAARRDAGCSARSRRGASLSRMHRERELGGAGRPRGVDAAAARAYAYCKNCLTV